MILSATRRIDRQIRLVLLAGVACLLLLALRPAQAQNSINISISGNPPPPANVGVGATYYITVSASDNFGGLVTKVGCQSSTNNGPTFNYYANNPSNTTYYTYTFQVSNPQDCMTVYWDGYTYILSNSSSGPVVLYADTGYICGPYNTYDQGCF